MQEPKVNRQGNLAEFSSTSLLVVDICKVWAAMTAKNTSTLCRLSEYGAHFMSYRFWNLESLPRLARDDIFLTSGTTDRMRVRRIFLCWLVIYTRFVRQTCPAKMSLVYLRQVEPHP